MKALVVLLTALCMALGFAWQLERVAHAHTQTSAAKQIAEIEQKTRSAETLNRKKEQELNHAAIEHASKVEKLLAENSRNSLRNSADSERVHRDAIAFVSSGGCRDTAIVGNVEAGQCAAVLLAELLRRIDERASELASFADESRIRGLACEADYDRANAQLKE